MALRPTRVRGWRPAGAASRDPRGHGDALIADDPPYLVFHQWLLIASASAFAVFAVSRSGGLAFIFENDTTYISEAILLLFVVTTLYCGARSWRLGGELVELQRAARTPSGPCGPEGAGTTAAGRADSEGIVRTYLGATRDRQAGPHGGEEADRALLADVLVERLRGPHDVGWFITETLTKLGLLGTVIGFLIMLSALIGTGQMEVSAMQSVLREMASGMGIKIIATVVGLLCNMVLALQWLLLDRCADKIVSGAAYLASASRRAGPDAPAPGMAPAAAVPSVAAATAGLHPAQRG